MTKRQNLYIYGFCTECDCGLVVDSWSFFFSLRCAFSDLFFFDFELWVLLLVRCVDYNLSHIQFRNSIFWSKIIPLLDQNNRRSINFCSKLSKQHMWLYILSYILFNFLLHSRVRLILQNRKQTDISSKRPIETKITMVILGTCSVR